MKYSNYAHELIRLLADDQLELRKFAIAFHDPNTPKDKLENSRTILRSDTMSRSQRMLEIVELISKPTISNIGEEASEAIGVLTLHSSLNAMEEILNKFETSFNEDPNDVYRQVIPALTDRVHILHKKKQIFGTQWLYGDDQLPFLYPTENFEQVNKYRSKYGLGKLKYPRIVALEKNDQHTIDEIVKPDAQRLPTEDEFYEYSRDYLNHPKGRNS